jgi:hypothetical protein
MPAQPPSVVCKYIATAKPGRPSKEPRATPLNASGRLARKNDGKVEERINNSRIDAQKEQLISTHKPACILHISTQNLHVGTQCKGARIRPINQAAFVVGVASCVPAEYPFAVEKVKHEGIYTGGLF